MENVTLGHEVVGSGPERLIVLNDWLCDTSTWRSARAYLDETRFSYAFADVRGYGRSRALMGSFTVPEAAADVLAVADALGWPQFSLVGHSMSTYFAMHLGQTAAARVRRVVLVTPGPPRGFGANAAWLERARAVARDDVQRGEMARARFSAHYSPGWCAYKCGRFLATAAPEAAAGYIAVYARDGLPDPTAPITAPVLAITGDEDDPSMRAAAAKANLSPLCNTLEIVGLPRCGHYPMEEMPPLTVSLIERFCSA